MRLEARAVTVEERLQQIIGRLIMENVVLVSELERLKSNGKPVPVPPSGAAPQPSMEVPP